MRGDSLFPDFDLEKVKQFGLLAVVLFGVWFYGRDLLPKLKKFLPTSQPATPSLTQATANVSDLIAYFQAVGCPEGVKAARSCGECLFHETHAEPKT
jgi:hypothetical protein